MKYEMRDYQKEALDVIYEDLKTEKNVLLRAIMGAGKSAMAVKLIDRLNNERDGFRAIILVHKKELVSQFVSAFGKFSSINQADIGICCAGLKQKDLSKRITIATVQTFYRVRFDYKPAHLIIIDEAHVIPYHDKKSRYRQVIDVLRAKRPNCRILGLTATPSRLGHGYIFGKRHRPNEENLFPEENHAVGYETLRKAGHLVPLIGKVAAHEGISEDLAGVSINGDYVLDQVGEIMSRTIHVKTTADAIIKHCAGYKTIVVFCCTISHAEMVKNFIDAEGEDCTIVHSQLTDIERHGNMESWKSGRTRIMVSVNILIEGFDLPRLDCLVMARPTMSSTLFLQAVGRVLRTHPGKEHGMLVDLTDNVNRFGTDLDNVKVTVPRVVEDIIEKELEDNLEKICPSCEAVVSYYLRVCDCGYAFIFEEVKHADSLHELVDITFDKNPPEKYDVHSAEIGMHQSKKNDKLLGKITMFYGHSHARIVAYFCLLDNYSGYAVTKSAERWGDFSDEPLPEGVVDFITKSIICPASISLDTNGKYPQIDSIERGIQVVDVEEVEYADEVPF